MTTRPLTSRSLKDRTSKVPDWFKPKNSLQEAHARVVLEGMEKQRQTDARRVEAAKASALPKAAEIIRRFDVRAKNFLGGKAFPWTSDSWERVQMDRFRKRHPYRYLVYRFTGLMAPTF